MPQNTNLNISPYFDDFDKDKNFYRVLFRPGFPIQARELTTMQSILQNQIESMGQHFFKEGAMVIPGQIGYDLNVKAVILQQNFLGVNVENYRTQLNGQVITGVTSGVKAKVLYSIPATESDKGYITLYVKYVDSGDTVSDEGIKEFQNNEQLYAENEITFGTTLIEINSPFAQLLPADATATGSVAYVNQGVYFIRGYFVDVPSSYLLLDQYTNNPSYRIGLEVSESIITPEDDPSLNDNAAGASNYSAPGGHRFRIKTTLVKKAINDDTDKNFIELLRINQSKVEQVVNKTAYSELERSLARRTYEESGDYVVDSFDVTAREHLDDFFNNGVYKTGSTATDGVAASDEYLAIEVGPGRAYVRGYRTEFLTPQYASVPKPRTFKTRQNGIISFELGQFVEVYDVYGNPQLTGDGVSKAYQTLELRDNWMIAPSGTTDYSDETGTGQGNIIGKARMVQMKYLRTDSSLGTDFHNAYLFDIQMFTAMNFKANVALSAGDRIFGRTSGASAYVFEGATTQQARKYILVYQVSGNFVPGEVVTRDGRIVGELDAIFSYQFQDTRSMVGRNPGNAIVFGANLALNDQYAIDCYNVDVDQASGQDIQGFGSNFGTELRPGEVIRVTGTTVQGNNTLRVKRINPQTIDQSAANKATSVAAGDVIFDYADQTAKLDTSLTKGTIPDGEYANGVVVRMRPYLRMKDYQNGELTIDLPYRSMRSLEDESFFVYRSFVNKVVSNGDITITLPESEAFGSLDEGDFTLTVAAQSGSSYTVGQNIDLETANDAQTLTVTFGAERQSISVQGLSGVTQVHLNALVSKNTVARKVKTASKMRCMKVIKTNQQNDTLKFGLSYGHLYGTRIEDTEVSFGLNDVYKIHAVYESETDGDAQIPYVVLDEATFFDTGSIVSGRTSGARARVVSFVNSTLRLYNVSVNNIPFVPGEIIDGFDDDGVALTAIVDDADGSVVLGSRNITSSFKLDPGQGSHFYDVSRMIRQPNSAPPTRKLMVVFDYFLHEQTGDYFSAQSYTGIPFKEIPNYKLDGNINFLVDSIDFRPGVGEQADGSGTVGAPYYVNCTSLDFDSRTFDTSGGSGGSTIFDIMRIETDFRADYTWYQGRMDHIYLGHNNKILVAQGKPGDELVPPDKVENAMLLATMELKPYVYDPERDVIIKPEQIRRFTMKDIGDIERRIGQVEYYTSLSLLEAQADSAKVYDENGFDRFKNGYVVDDFTDHTVGDVLSEDYKCSLDFKEGILRPSHYTTNVALEWNETASNNVIKHEANIITLPFNEEKIVEQPYASRQENVNPFNVFTFIGRIDLTPASDDWIDTKRLPARVENVEGDFSATARDLNIDQNGFAPIQWGSWQTNWTGETQISSSRFQSSSGTYGIGRPQGRAGHGQRRQGLFYLHERRTYRVVNNQSRQGIRTRVVPRIDRKSLGDSILSQTAVPWIRSRNVGYKVSRMKPNTRFYSFFDNVNVNTYMCPKIIELVKSSTADPTTNETPFVVGETVIGSISGCRLKVAEPNDGGQFNPYTGTASTLPESYASQTDILNIDVTAMAETKNPDFYGNIAVGEVLVGQTSGARAVVKDRRLISNNVGEIAGSLFIPNPNEDSNPRFATGTRTFRFTTNEDNSKMPGTVDSSAETTYEARGTLNTVRENILAVRNAEIVRDTVSEDRVVTTTRTETRQIGWYDPLAQSFILDEEGGMFINSVEIFFSTKDGNIPISMQIRTMENGYPTGSILPFSDVTLNPDQVETSENAAIPTKFTFRAPVYIKQSTEYCFVLLSDSNEYKVWISRMGDVDVTGTRTISEQPYAGVLFKSQNASTWTADQYEDLKFVMYRCDFTPSSGVAVFNNCRLGKGNGGIHNLIENPILTLKPKQVLTLPSSGSYSFTIGATVEQDPSGAKGTVVEWDTTGANPKLTITDIETGPSGQGFQAGFVQSGGSIYNVLKSSQATVSITTSVVTNGTFETGDTITNGANAEAVVTSFDSGTGILEANYNKGTFLDSDTITNGSGVSATINASGVVYGASSDSRDGYPEGTIAYQDDDREVLVYHKNHGMHQRTNNIVVEGIESEIPPTVLTSSLAADATSINVQDALSFHNIINNSNVGPTNVGYVKIGDEIIKYSAISSTGQTITVASDGRGADGTAAVAHSAGEPVLCYNLDGIPLVELNKTHTSISCPWLDTYMLHTDSVATNGIRGGGKFVYATQNVQYETLTPQVATMNLPETDIRALVNTTTATSISDGSTNIDQASFINTGDYLEVVLNDQNFFTSPRMIAAQINENNKMEGAKSFTMQIQLATSNPHLTPVVDLDRCSLITTSNRINYWPGGSAAIPTQAAIDRNADTSTDPVGDQNDAIYCTRLARLANESRSLRLAFQITRNADAFIYPYYKVFTFGASTRPEDVDWTPFPENINYDSTPSEELLWKDFEYEVKGLNFNAFQIKLVMKSKNQASVPLIADLRATALAT